jgi:tRNA(Ile2) C34 agmatinyltransferase TiaS
MPHTMLPTTEEFISEDIISDILNWVCPECGGRMGGRTKEFKCQGECRTDWRDVWERRLVKPSKNTNSPRALDRPYKGDATTEAAREVSL